MAISFVQFLANFIIAAFLLRLVEIKFPDSAVGKALMFLH